MLLPGYERKMQSEAKKDAVCRAKFSVYGSRRDEKEEHTQPQPARAER